MNSQPKTNPIFVYIFSHTTNPLILNDFFTPFSGALKQNTGKNYTRQKLEIIIIIKKKKLQSITDEWFTALE